MPIKMDAEQLQAVVKDYNSELGPDETSLTLEEFAKKEGIKIIDQDDKFLQEGNEIYKQYLRYAEDEYVDL